MERPEDRYAGSYIHLENETADERDGEKQTQRDRQRCGSKTERYGRGDGT